MLNKQDFIDVIIAGDPDADPLKKYAAVIAPEAKDNVSIKLALKFLGGITQVARQSGRIFPDMELVAIQSGVAAVAAKEFDTALMEEDGFPDDVPCFVHYLKIKANGEEHRFQVAPLIRKYFDPTLGPKAVFEEIGQ